MQYNTGDLYEGHLSYGLREGKGKYTTIEGQVFAGEWQKDQLVNSITD